MKPISKRVHNNAGRNFMLESWFWTLALWFAFSLNSQPQVQPVSLFLLFFPCGATFLCFPPTLLLRQHQAITFVKEGCALTKKKDSASNQVCHAPLLPSTGRQLALHFRFPSHNDVSMSKKVKYMSSFFSTLPFHYLIISLC